MSLSLFKCVLFGFDIYTRIHTQLDQYPSSVHELSTVTVQSSISAEENIVISEGPYHLVAVLLCNNFAESFKIPFACSLSVASDVEYCLSVRSSKNNMQ